MSRPASIQRSDPGKRGSRASTSVSKSNRTPTPEAPEKLQPPRFIVTGPPAAGERRTTASSSRPSTKTTTSSTKSRRKKEQQTSELHVLPPEEMYQLRKVFTLYDKDNDGTISTRELKSILRAIGQSPSEAEIQDMIHEQDLYGDGYLTFSDFTHLMAQRKMSENTEDQLLAAFHAFDRDRDGHITAAELRRVMRNMGDTMTDEEIEDFITETDINGDGVIDYNEFLKMMLFQ